MVEYDLVEELAVGGGAEQHVPDIRKHLVEQNNQRVLEYELES